MALIPRVLFAGALLLGGVEAALAHTGFVPALVLQGVALVWWVRSPGSLAGLVVVAPIAIAAVWESQASPSGVHHGKLLPAAACLAWSAGAWKSRVHAHEAACGIVAAAYGLAAGSKLAGSGLRWFDADNLGLLMIERATGPLASVRILVAATPWLCVTLATAALLAEAHLTARAPAHPPRAPAGVRCPGCEKAPSRSACLPQPRW